MADYSKFDRAIDLMARTGVSLFEALTELGEAAYSAAEAARVERREPFQKKLWAARHAYYSELAADPAFGKQSLIGSGLMAVNRLLAEGQWDKALDGILKLARIMGVVGGDQSVNVFQTLTKRDIDDIRRQVEAGAGRPAGAISVA